jgi:hypothetical protein
MKNLKCFSLTSYNITFYFDRLVIPLLRRMKHLEKLTLYLRIDTLYGLKEKKKLFLDGKYLDNEILIYMSQLRSLIFYISIEIGINDLPGKCPVDILETFGKMKYGEVACILDKLNKFKSAYHVYSLPFRFTRLGTISNHFPNILFDTVTHLYVTDVVAMKHEFFIQISRCFPVLKHFSLKNEEMQSSNADQNLSHSVIEYPHLVSLHIMYVAKDYLVQFLLETKSYLPCLTELKVSYYQLKFVTMNFTRDTMRQNCSKVKRLILEKNLPKHAFQYFPSL